MTPTILALLAIAIAASLGLLDRAAGWIDRAFHNAMERW
jgi:hypothetical protein